MEANYAARGGLRAQAPEESRDSHESQTVSETHLRQV